MEIQKMMQKIEEHLTQGNRSFVIPYDERNGWKILYSVVPMGTGNLVYTSEFKDEVYLVSEYRRKLELAFLVSGDHRFLVVDSFAAFGKPADLHSKGNWQSASDYKSSILHEADNALGLYLEKLPMREPNQIEKGEANKLLRCAALGSWNSAAEIKLESVMSREEMLLSWIGLVSVTEKINAYLESQKEKLLSRKIVDRLLHHAMDLRQGMEPWEFDLAEGIRDLDAKNVTVEFSLNGKTSAGKVPLYQLKSLFQRNDSFCSYYFATNTEGERVLHDLGAADYVSSGKPILRLENIVSVTYGKKKLYTR